MATIDTITNRPESGMSAGDAYFETSSDKIVVWTGSAWTELASDTVPSFSNTYSLDFDGANDFIQTPYRPSAGSTFSASFWMKSSDTSSSMGWFSIMDAFGTYGIFLTTPSSTKGWYYGWNGVTRNATIGGSNATLAVRDGSWHHVAMTVNGTTVKIYTDGTIVGTDTAPSAYSGPTSGSGSGGTGPDLDYVIGRGYGVGAYQYNGLIDELAFFETELTGSNISAIYNSGVPNDLTSLSPVGWWRMGDNDSGAGTTITDQGSGGNDGTLTNGPTFSTDVPVALTNTYSVELDGTNDYVDCGGNADFSFTDGSGNDSPFSISAWVKLDSATQARVAGKGNMEWLFGTDSSNQFNLILWSNDGTSAYLQKYSSVLSTGSWHHIAATYDGSNTAAGITLYLAGSSVSSTDGSVGTYAGMASQQGALRIGQWEFNNSVMDGLIDEVAVFNSELSASDVTAIYNSGVPADLTSLSPLGYWRMGDNNSGTGTTITDQGSGGNDGTLVNGPTFSSDVPS